MFDIFMEAITELAKTSGFAGLGLKEIIMMLYITILLSNLKTITHH